MTQCHTEFLTYPSKTIVRFLNIPFDHVLLGQTREEGEMGNPMLKNVGSFWHFLTDISAILRLGDNFFNIPHPFL